jgi:solute carrier family 50 protein (sugar transporter)
MGVKYNAATCRPDAFKFLSAKNTGGRSIVQYCAMLIDNLVGIWFSTVIGDTMGLKLRYMGTVLNLFYLYVMLKLSRKRSKDLQLLGLTVGAFAVYAATLVFAVPQSAWRDILGATGMLASIAFAASPLAEVKTVLKTGDASSIPFNTVAVLAVCAVSWATYGTLLKNIWMIIPNAVNAALATFQVILCLVFTGSKSHRKPDAFPMSVPARLRSPTGMSTKED